MKIRIEPRFDECSQCEHFDPTRIKRECLGCRAGENFEPTVDETEPSDADLYDMLKEWSRDDA
ncbi:hypothetical protein [Methylorubrum extorquens]|uniref:hypothetical protein n=1 Tax=Methylorubrum extorquens TaxID=408 RepID=UPI00209DC7C6|nr:hypothetical protein [Methylorubrum extorquens]MCP1540079.1 hypothetical protein [Methylorubrum extorquens]